MKTFRIAALALAVSGVFATGARAGSTTNEWWDVDFDILGAEAALNPADAMVTLTNQYRLKNGEVVSYQTWDEGFWVTLDGDETTVTNEFNPTNTFKQYGTTTCLKLDTQGNDLTWLVDPTNTMADSRTALVDADLYLVGSDSPPDAADFDASGDVQAAVYLKNETDEDSGETTNSVLCVYVYDSDAEANYWQELKGVELHDNSWASVKVIVDHAKIIDKMNPYPVVQVFVNGVKMTARDGNTDNWTAANFTTAQTAGRVSSVAFRGTGAVDNFVGKTVETTFDRVDFTAEVYMNGTVVAADATGVPNKTQIAENIEANVPYTFEGFTLSNFDYENYDTNATWSLTKIEIIDPATGATTTYEFGWDSTFQAVVPPEGMPSTDVYIDTDEEFGTQTGGFSVTAPTAGATEDSTIVKIYFEDLPEEGQFKMTASQNVGTAPPTQIFNVNDENLPAFATFTFAESITVGGTSYILSKIKPGTAPTADPITLEYESPNAVVTVPIDNQIDEGVYNVATATYVEGTLGDKVLGYEWDEDNGEWSFTAKDKPVAMIGDVEYPSLRAAVAAAQTGDTIVMVADDAVSFTAEAPELMIDKAITIDGGSNTLYGVSAHACATIDDRLNLAISGNGDVTIKNLKMAQFSDTATVQYYTYPIWVRGAYGGTLTLDGVTITDFSRTAVNISGGAVVITNCVFTGDTTRLDVDGHAFQGGVEVGNGLTATVTIVDTTITGMGSVGYPADSDSDMAAAVQMSGKGTITIESGAFAGQYSLIVSATATGGIVVNGGEFEGDVCVEDGSGALAIHGGLFVGDIEVASGLNGFIDGGWFDSKPADAYIAAGLSAVDYGAAAPDARATWTVGTLCTITFNHEDDTLILTTNVLAGTTNYAPAEDPAPVDGRLGVTFAGWTNKVAGGAVVLTKDLPAADGNATWTATFGPLVIVKPAVNPGDGLKDYVPGEGETVPAPIEFTDDAAPKCEISFVAPESGWYVLYSSTTVDGEYTEDTASGKTVAKGELTTLVETTPGTTKFFKIYWSASAPAGD